MSPPASLILSGLLSQGAFAAPVALNPAVPPVRVGGTDQRPRYRFGEGAEWEVLPGVVLQLQEGALPPTGAVPLGGPFYRLPSRAPVADALALAGAPGVAAVFPDVVLPTRRSAEDLSFDDPSYGGQWYLEKLNATALFAVSLGDPSVRVAVIDSGIDIAHSDLAAAVDAPYDAYDDDDDPSPNDGEYCTGGATGICDEHGTAVSGVVAARANNGVGIVGLCPECTLVPIKMLGEDGRGISVTIAAFEHAIAEDVGVINNSWGYVDPTTVPELLANAISAASTEPRDGKGALVIFAAGNDDRELEDDEVEALPDVLCVSATDSYGRWTNYTNYGAAVDVSAPSATVTIAPGDEVITNFGGTSAAAPVVSGLAAWALSVNPDLTASELHALMIASAVQSPLITPDEDGHHDYFGYGEISGEKLLENLLGSPDTAGDTAVDTDTGGTADSAAGSVAKRGGCACSSSERPGRGLGWVIAAGVLACVRRLRTAACAGWTTGCPSPRGTSPPCGGRS